MTVDELIAAIRERIQSVQGVNPRVGPYGALEGIASILDDFEQEVADAADASEQCPK